MPRVSVLIPAFNVEGFIAEAVESALGQTFKDLEIVVVDDGSTDRTVSALEPFESQIHVIHQENRGLAGARNAALSKATGEVIALIDADDIWLPSRVEKLIAQLDADQMTSIVTSDAYLMFDQQATTLTYYNDFLPSRTKFRDDDQEFWITQSNFVFVMTAFRRELFERHGGWDEQLRTCEDWDLLIRMISGGARVGFVDEPLAYYRIRSDSLSRSLDRMYADSVTVLSRAVDSVHERARSGAKGALDLVKGASACSRGDFAEARGAFARAAFNPSLHVATRAQAGASAIFPRLAWKRLSRTMELKAKGPANS